MCEFLKVMQQFKRMCGYYSRDKAQKSCPMCISYPNCNIGQCRKIAFDKPAHFAATVMRWAKENPEPPVYPTWREYVMSLLSIDDKGNDHIPEDIAKILKIDPINSQSEHTL